MEHGKQRKLSRVDVVDADLGLMLLAEGSCGTKRIED